MSRPYSVEPYRTKSGRVAYERMSRDLATKLELLCIWDMLGYAFASYANSRLRLADCLSRLRKIIAWQYSQEKNRRNAA